MKSKPKYSSDIVQEIRHSYFIDGIPVRRLSKKYNCSPTTMMNIIHSRKGYANITDTIPQTKKDNREEERAKAQTSKYFQKKFFDQLYENNPSIRPTHKPKQKRVRLPKSLADNVQKVPQWTPAKEKKFQESQKDNWWE